jgi:hypothetical protein
MKNEKYRYLCSEQQKSKGISFDFLVLTGRWFTV